MTTIVQYVQQPGIAFEFQATLDNQQYTCVLMWNIFGRRLYLNILTSDNVLVVCEALVGSPPALNIQSLSWANGTATLITATPHGFRTLDTIALTVSGCAPAPYNGIFDMLAIDNFTLTFPIVSDPGPPSQIGQVAFNINLVEQYFQTSTMVYRAGNQNFEINP